MTAIDPRAPQVTESYPGEALVLLRNMASDVAYLRQQFDAFAPLLERFRSGGLLAGRRAMKPAHPQGKAL